jgi:hypothetical protein
MKVVVSLAPLVALAFLTELLSMVEALLQMLQNLETLAKLAGGSRFIDGLLDWLVDWLFDCVVIVINPLHSISLNRYIPIQAQLSKRNRHNSPRVGDQPFLIQIIRKQGVL